MKSLRTHYLYLGKARCGHPHHRNWTVVPERVTCGNCKKLMKGQVE